MKTIITLFISLCYFTAHAQTDKPLNERLDMKQYYLVFLKEGKNRAQDSATTAKIMEGHLAHLTKMYDDNYMSVCGPLLDDGIVKGICIYHIDDAEKVRRLAEADPAVKSGRLEVEIHPFYSAKGMVLK